MKWRIELSKNSLNFIEINNVQESSIVEKIILAVRRFKGENVNIDIKKLSGKWEGFHRIRVGRLRIIVEFQFDRYKAYIEEIDWRGNVYK